MSNNTSRKNTTVVYGLFYKSHGKWIGPYANKRWNSLNSANVARKTAMKTLKSKVSVRKVNVVS